VYSHGKHQTTMMRQKVTWFQHTGDND